MADAFHGISRARPEHIGAVMQLYRAFEAERGRTVDDEELGAVGEWAFRSLYDDTRRIWVALAGKKIKGLLCASAIELPFGPYRRHVFAVLLYVRPEARRFGIATDLTGVLEAWAKELGVPVTTQCDETARPYWTERGYRVVAHFVVKEG